MYLQDGTRTHFMNFIEREFPSMAPRFEKLYAKKYPPDAYRKEVQGDGAGAAGALRPEAAREDARPRRGT